MRPTSYKPRKSSNFLVADHNTSFGTANTIGSIKGSVKKLGSNYSNVKIALYGKATLLPILVKKPDVNGSYQFLGLNLDMRCFITAFDNSGQFNMVAQDSVVPK